MAERGQSSSVLVAIDTGTPSLRALEFVLEQLAPTEKTLCVHLVHVVRTLSTQLEVYLGCGPGSAYNFADPTPHHEIADVLNAKKFLHEEIVPKIEGRGFRHELHLFVETASAPPQAIYDVIAKVAGQVQPMLLAIGCNNKDDDLALGPVAKLCQQGLTVPVALIR